MKNNWTLICILWALSFTSAYAQIEPDLPLTERMQAMKVAFITEKIGLTAEQSQGFWPIYNDFQDEQKAIRTAFNPPLGIAQMSDQDLEDHLYTMLDNEARLVELKRTYIRKFQEVITIRQIAQLQAAERDFNRQVVERLLELRKRRGRN